MQSDAAALHVVMCGLPWQAGGHWEIHVDHHHVKKTCVPIPLVSSVAGDLSRILPFEAHLLAAGWPRFEPAADTAADGAASGPGGDAAVAAAKGDGSASSGGGQRVLAREGSRAARLLFMARR